MSDGGSRQPLLAHAHEDALWDRVEAAPPIRAGPTVAQLLREHPANVIRTLQRSGVQKVAEFRVEVRGAGL